MGDIVAFPSRAERQHRDRAARLDRARRDWTVMSDYDREAAAAAMTEFYRVWFETAEPRDRDARDRD